MSPENLTRFLESRDGIDPELARWAYERRGTGEHGLAVRILALEIVARGERRRWARAWLWRELERRKGDAFGDRIAIALTRWGVKCARDAIPFMRLYADPTAHPHTRGSALFGMASALEIAEVEREFGKGPTPLDERTWAELRATCEAALRDEHPYARAGACGLAGALGGFDEALERLARDRTPASPGVGPVAVYAEQALGR